MHTTRVALFLLTMLTVGQNASAQSDHWVDSTLAGLSLEEKVGQMFVVEFVGLFTNEQHPAYRYALDVVTRLKVGGCILGGGAVLDIPYVTNSLQHAARVPLLINGDFEAGMSHVTIWRRSRGWTEKLPSTIASGGTMFPSQMAIGATGEPRYAYELGRITALESRAVGVQWTNSPVADVNSNADNPVINTRSFGEDPAQVAAMVEAYVRGAEQGRVISTLKHFPGHGDTREDSHMGLPSLPFDRARLDAVEFVPFKAGIAAGARAVMTSHLALPRIDPSGRPATLSSPVLTGILRKELGFGGIIVTDGMRMQGITDAYSSAEAAVLAVEAGVDVILAPVDADSAIGGVIAAVRSGRIAPGRIDASVRRILSAKAWAGLADRRTTPLDSVFTRVGTPAFGRIAQEISDASVTLLRNDYMVIPFSPSSRVIAVAVTEDPSPGISTDFVEELLPATGTVTLIRVSNDTGRERFAAIRDSARGADVTVVGIYLSVIAWKGERRFAPPLADFLASLPNIGRPVVIVAYGDPYVLGKVPLTAGAMTPFNGTRLAEISVARALTGKIPVRGRLPVTIPGRYRLGEGLRLPAR